MTTRDSDFSLNIKIDHAFELPDYTGCIISRGDHITLGKFEQLQDGEMYYIKTSTGLCYAGFYYKGPDNQIFNLSGARGSGSVWPIKYEDIESIQKINSVAKIINGKIEVSGMDIKPGDEIEIDAESSGIGDKSTCLITLKDGRQLIRKTKRYDDYKSVFYGSDDAEIIYKNEIASIYRITKIIKNL